MSNETKSCRFTAGIALDALASEVFNSSVINRIVLDALHGSSPCKPFCPEPECRQTLEDEKQVSRYYALERITCPSCGKQPFATKGTVLQGSRLTPADLFALAILTASGRSSGQIVKQLGFSPDTVRKFRNLLQEDNSFE